MAQFFHAVRSAFPIDYEDRITMELFSCCYNSSTKNHYDYFSEVYNPPHDYNYEKDLKKWINKAPLGKKDIYIKVGELLLKYHKKPEKLLNLSKLGLTSLPPLPPDVKSIDLSHNNFKKIPHYHRWGPEEMDFSFCKIKKLQLDILPQTLKILTLTGNPLDFESLFSIEDEIFRYKIIFGDNQPPHDPNAKTIGQTISESFDSVQVSEVRAYSSMKRGSIY